MRMSLLMGVCAVALAAGPVLAADLSVKAPPAPAPIQPYNWSGFYLGANIGGAWSHASITDVVTGASLSSDNSGFIGGGQVGFNYQANNWLFGANWIFGVEWDIDGTTISKTSNPVTTAFGTLQASADTDWISTLTGRVGWGFDRWMLYVKGGGAWVQDSVTLSNLTTGVSVGNTHTNSGWTAGIGAEWAFSGPWSAKLEYDHIGLNDWTPSTSSVIINDRLNVTRDIDMVKFGINYRFGWGNTY